VSELKLGVALGRLNPALHLEVAVLADQLGFESLWMPEHLIFPVDMAGSPYPGADHPPVPPTTPVFDCFAWLGHLAAHTERIRLGSHVFLLALRHPFVAARAIQTLDLVSGGRAEIGIGAGWLESEFRAVGIDWKTRGRRLDEALACCKHLWSDETIEFEGEFFAFEPVAFEPKPVQRPWPPIHVGGESPAALRRAARQADGWIGLDHTPESVRAPVAKLAELRQRGETADGHFEISVGGEVANRDDLARFAEAGVDRLIVSPWRRSREALDGLRRLADAVLA
jgi:probable F420-dependent oxidoreductase